MIISDLTKLIDDRVVEGHEVAIKSFEFMRGFGFALTKLKLENKVLTKVKSNQIAAIFKRQQSSGLYPMKFRMFLSLQEEKVRNEFKWKSRVHYTDLHKNKKSIGNLDI